MRLKGFKAGLIGAALCMSMMLLASPVYAGEIETEADETKEDTLLDTEGAKKAYAQLSDDGKTLTFKYDDGFDLNSDKMWDVSDTGHKNPGWLVQYGNDKYSAGNTKITSVVFESSFANARPKSCNGWFLQLSNLKTISGIANLNTSAVQDMNSLFYGSFLSSIDLSGFDTSNVTDMERMFCCCSQLQSIDVSGFDTSKVTTMLCMFDGCKKLESLDLRGFNTANVEHMGGMFSCCESLTTLDLSSFNTSKVTDMDFMFRDCLNLKALDLSGFDTSKVTNMESMFDFDKKLESLNLSSFNTSNVTNMYGMFCECYKLTELDVSSFDTSNVTEMGNMFFGCGMKKVDVSNFNTSKVKSMSQMFYGTGLTELDLSSFDTSNVEIMWAMFSSNMKLTTLNISDFDLSSVKKQQATRMFHNCLNLTTIYCNNTWPEGGVGLFEGCTKLVGAIKYDKEKVSSEYANPDTGYFTRIEKKSDDKKDPEQVNNFVERMYTTALGRAAEAKGKNYWASQLLDGKSDGATLARGFICSKEFTDKNMSDEDFVDTLYHTFFDRNPDEGGRTGWLDQLKNNTPRTQVLAGFVNSAEFGNLCEKFGIARGTMEADGSNIYNEGVYNFVKRNYTKTLGRKGEIAGIEDWCHRVNTGQISMKEVAIQFLNSEEFLNKNTSNEEYVKVLYRTFMDREADAAGLADWKGQLDRGEKTRDEVVNGFADSQEFADIMAKYQ